MGSPTPPASSIRVLPRGDDTEQRLLRKILMVLCVGSGLVGVDFIADAVAHTGDWWIVHALQDSVIASITYASGTNTGSLAGSTLKAGDRIYGNITAIRLTSGSVELYRAAP